MGCCSSKPLPPPVVQKPAPVEIPKPAPVPEKAKPEPKPLSPVRVKSPEPVKASTPKSFASPPPSPKAPTPKAPTPEPEEFKCANGHDYLWHTDTPFFYLANYGTPLINCNKCKNTYSCAGWHCRLCLDDICIECAGKFGMETSYMVCSNDHELIWSAETTGIYGSSFNCNTCEETGKMEPNWNCSECQYDVCIKCGSLAGFSPPFNLLVCESNHCLSLVSIEVTEGEDFLLRCNTCEKDIHTPRSYRCTDCDFDMCLDCAKERISRMIPHPGYKCPEGKSLELKDVPEVGEDEEAFRCAACGNSEMKQAFLCGDCAHCYCLRCSRELFHGISHCYTKKCQNRHGLAWLYVPKYESQRFKCNVCSNVYKSGSFTCTECNYDVCIKDIRGFS